MTALVVVHPEGADKTLQQRLVNAIQKRIREKKPVYVLPYGHDVGMDRSSFFYSRHEDVVTIESYYSFHKHRVIPYEGREYSGTSCFAPQFLALKKQLLADQQKKVNLCGVAREVCVTDVYRLLTTLPSQPWINYGAAGDYLGMERIALQYICNTPIKTRVLADLCDIPLSSQDDVFL